MDAKELTLEQIWNSALDRLFPGGVPAHAVWNSRNAIADTLGKIAAPNAAHLYYPSGGGDDLVAAQRDADPNLMRLGFDDEGEANTIIRPSQLEFYCREGCRGMAYFILQNDRISEKPAFPNSANNFYEEYAQDATGRTYTRQQWDNNDDGHGNDLPDSTGLVCRYWGGGTMAMFAKSSPYNRTRFQGFDAYDSFHLNPDFDKAVDAFVKLSKQKDIC